MNFNKSFVLLGCSLAATLSNSLASPTSAQETPRVNRSSAIATVNRPTQAQEAAATMLDGHNQFACEMYQQLHNEPGNLFFSPSSIWTALAMTYVGAAGSTESEMANTLHINSNELRASYEAVKNAWQITGDSNDVQLRIANRLWGQKDFPFLPNFLATTRDQFDAELSLLNFADSHAARTTINQWVEKQTEDKIQELLPEGVIDASTMLVLTNAVYFKGAWSTPFSAESTREDNFNLSPSQTIEAPLMHQLGQFAYRAVDTFQILEMPYGDGQLAMTILLPNAVDGLAELEKQLNAENLDGWLAGGLRSQKVNVTLPKFKTTSDFELNGVLAAMGMPSAFDAGSADFSKMSGNRDLFLSAVIHKAFVDVNEEGTEAAAATGAVMSRTSISPQTPPEFRADRPFVYLIRDVQSGGILFLGRMSDPSK